MASEPAWRDPRYLTAQRVGQFEAHEATLREREWARARRRLEALMATDTDVPSDDFDGAVEQVRRLLPQHFKRDGQPKKALTQTEAREAAMRSRKHAYRCKFCGHWHIGGHDGPR